MTLTSTLNAFSIFAGTGYTVTARCYDIAGEPGFPLTPTQIEFIIGDAVNAYRFTVDSFDTLTGVVVFTIPSYISTVYNVGPGVVRLRLICSENVTNHVVQTPTFPCIVTILEP